MSFPQRLIEGYSAFAGGRLKSEQDRFRQLAETGQSPDIMVIGCCDSRVAPEAIFDAGPGELFVARNIANLVPPYTPDGAQRAVSAALEFAVQALRVLLEDSLEPSDELPGGLVVEAQPEPDHRLVVEVLDQRELLQERVDEDARPTRLRR